MKYAEAFTDGGTRGGNPGISGCGFVLLEDGEIIVEAATLIEDKCSNNVAEFCGIAFALFNAAERGYTHIDIYTDSQIVQQQLSGVYAVKSPNLIEPYEETKEEEARFECVTYNWIPREQNRRADYLVRKLLDDRMAK